MLAPEICHFAKVCKPSGIPWFVIIILPELVASLAVWIAANAEICLADIPGKAQHDRFRCPWSQCERHKQTSSRRRFAQSDRRILVAFSLLNIFPRHGQRVKPAASKPCMIHLHLRIIHRGGKSTFFPPTVFGCATPQNESTRRGLDCVRVLSLPHEIFRVPGKNRFLNLRGFVREPILQRRYRQAGVVRVTGFERTPPRHLNSQRQFFIGQRNGGKRKSCAKGRLTQTRQPERCAPSAVATARRAKFFPIWHRPFNHPWDIRCAFYKYRGKRFRLIEYFMKKAGVPF